MPYSTLLLLLFIFSGGLLAADARFTLTLTPDKCAVSADMPRCKAQVQAAVTANYTGMLCIVAQQQQHCQLHQPERVSLFQLQLDSSEAVHIDLRDEQQQVVRSSRFVVYQYIEKPRPRRGYLWNSL
ncbi:DUF3019 domain-containing protein [Arsukibacterium sp.]|uniref:DUF3019 domain-containing protein n=1 Tax=Arsukibacterium sp. TaxID=1977258 RepID=UPI002FDAC630